MSKIQKRLENIKYQVLKTESVSDEEKILMARSIYDAAIFEEFLQYYGWVYVTTDDMPNPWDSVSTELSDIYNAIG